MPKSKKLLYFVLTVLALALVLSWHTKSSWPAFSEKTIINLAGGNRDNIDDVTSVVSSRWTPYMDVVDLSILKEPALKDINTTANVDKSFIRIIDRKPFYRVGDEISIHIQLYDGLSRRREVGGDKLNVRIFEDSLQAGASGYVLDHKNGTYTAVVKCLWAGQPSISVYIDLMRETVRMMLKYLDKNGAAVIFHVTYENGETHPCQPFIYWLKKSAKLCNMTERNGGMSWYCVAPEGKNTSCKDVYRFGSRDHLMDLSTTKAEESLNRQEPVYFPLMRIKVQDQLKDSYKQPIKPLCSAYDKRKLWWLPSPIGHFYHDKWVPRHCTMPSPDKFEKCLANRHVILYGDSTIFQWHTKLCQTYACSNCEGRPEGWKTDLSSYCRKINLTLDWVGHSLPGNALRTFSNSVAKHIFKYQNQKNMIFVIHLYSHLFRHHNSVFKDRMRRIRKAIETYLKVNKDAKFLIKGPNSYKPTEILRYDEYPFRAIMLEEFKGLYDKVIYLDQHDANIARHETIVHPHDVIVTDMVNLMLAYICDPSSEKGPLE